MKEPKFIITTCAGREHFLLSLLEQIPNAIVNFDDFTTPEPYLTTAFRNYMRSWELAGDDPAVFLDDDTVLCNNFREKILKDIAERPDDIIQFFSMRKDDLTIGSRYLPGSSFLMQQCYYLPKGMAAKVMVFVDQHGREFAKANPGGKCPTDGGMAEYFRLNKIKYWVRIPNLVDHRVARSKIDRRRSSKRQSKTFIKD